MNPDLEKELKNWLYQHCDECRDQKGAVEERKAYLGKCAYLFGNEVISLDGLKEIVENCTTCYSKIKEKAEIRDGLNNMDIGKIFAILSKKN